MENDKLKATIVGVAILLYLILFKVYQVQKTPTGRGIIHELRLAIAERLIMIAFNIMPNSKEKAEFGKALLDCIDKVERKF